MRSVNLHNDVIDENVDQLPKKTGNGFLSSSSQFSSFLLHCVLNFSSQRSQFIGILISTQLILIHLLYYRLIEAHCKDG